MSDLHMHCCTTVNIFELPIIGSPGESALLSCHCPYKQENITDGAIWTYEPFEPFEHFEHFEPFEHFDPFEHFEHFEPSLEAKDRTEVSNERGPYRGRVYIFDQTPSSNRSLLISNLTRNDQGQYLCGDSSYVILMVTGCSLSENQQHVEISRSPGESVFLPCSCTDLQEEPVKMEWSSPHHEDLHSTELSYRYSGRVQRFNDNFPGNLSLLISNLTEEDHGLYSCWINHNQHRNFSLTVKGINQVMIAAGSA
ncbi:polymeric immunoglobulin receptor-like [Electrophorus electricus]|uniref:polymeric immunoglobulin receptor-like n=1 Tax=Electrophorus electricus TaxID=8005 RepID=UPI0015D05917|nr:polymeric immunoglobulin receptor-like [Electrophorus electricus]